MEQSWGDPHLQVTHQNNTQEDDILNERHEFYQFVEHFKTSVPHNLVRNNNSLLF